MRGFLFALLFASTSAYGSVVVVTDPSLIKTTDILNWGQVIGGDGAAFPQTYTLTDPNTYNQITLHLNSGSGTVLVAGTDGPTGPGIAAGDDLISTGGNAPISFYLPSVYGIGAYLDGDGLSQFTARIQAFAGVNSVLDTTVTSDAAGDPLFLGVSDSSAAITRVVYSLTSAANGLTGQFVMDSLLVQNAPLVQAPSPTVPSSPSGVGTAPEPGTFALMGGALLGVALALKKRISRV